MEIHWGAHTTPAKYAHPSFTQTYGNYDQSFRRSGFESCDIFTHVLFTKPGISSLINHLLLSLGGHT